MVGTHCFEAPVKSVQWCDEMSEGSLTRKLISVCENIPVLAWPAYSPDMSPIEHF